jgi:putative DNA primase/helicase
MNKRIIRSNHHNPCPVCDRTKDGDCSWYPDGGTVMCKTCVDGSGHDESQWHYNGVNELGFQGKFVLKKEPAFVKPPRPKSRKDYYYPDRDNHPLVKVTRIDDGEGNKGFPQSHWDGGKWVKGNPDEIKLQVPIYRYVEVRAAISRNELIFIVEGEATADVLWKLGIPATTTIGGSGSYSNYGSYLDDLKGARLVLCPDRDANGLKYMSNFERDSSSQIEGWYLAGTAGLWRNPQGGMDIHDDIRDHDYSKEQILDRVISPSDYRQIFNSDLVQAQLLELIATELLLADGKPRFTTNWDDGLNWETAETTPDGNIKRVRKFIGNHIEAIAYVKNPEGGGTGILLEFRTQRHELLRLLIPRTTLVGDGLEALRAIVDKGYYYHLDCKKQLLGYLFGLGGDVERVYTIADKTGWVNGSFLTPAKTYGDGDLRFRDPEPDNNMTQIEGTLDGWKREVAAKCAGNSRLLFSLGTAFAAPLLPLAQIESGGFHLVGTTSIGKTTALNLAASVAGLKTIPSWRSTSNALEGKAAEFNHMLLPLDELNQADPQTVGASAYMLGNGQGKNRMSKTLSTVKPKTWELLFLSTGEVSMTDYLRQAKTPAKGGMEARMPSIRADAEKGYGVFENLHGYETSDEFVASLETAIRQHQGTAQDAYLTDLVETRSGASTGRLPPGCVRQDKVEGFDKELRARVHAIAGKLSQQFQDTAISRVAIRFALVQVGLELAHSFNLLPFPIEQCGWAVKQMFDAWLNIRGGAGSIEIKEACNRIEHLFVSNQHGDRVADTHNPVNVRNLLAYRHIDDLTKEAEFWVPPAIFDKELADGVDRKGLIKELQIRGWLKPSLDERPTLRRRLEINKQQRFFVFRDFWTNDEKSPSDLGNNKKVLDSVDSLDSKAEISPETEVLPSPGESSSKNGSGLGGLAPENSESTESSSKNSTGLGWTQPELSQGETFTMSSPASPASPAKNHVSENSPEKNHQFKVGDRVRYNGNNPNLLKQYAGILEIFEVSGETYACLKPDGKLTSWIEFEDLKIDEIAA